MSEEHLNGTRAPVHFARMTQTLCGFAKEEVYGATLVSTMQAKFLMATEGEEVRPYDTDHASLILGE